MVRERTSVLPAHARSASRAVRSKRSKEDQSAMTDYDPRTATGIPTEPVGSLPRPSKLQAAYADYEAGKITRGQLEEGRDKAVCDSIKRFEATRSPSISDGEQRVSSFSTYPVTDTLAGTGLADYL